MHNVEGGGPAHGESRGAAFFDVDGTVVSTHIVHQFLHVRRVLAQRRGAFWGSVVYPVWKSLFVLKCVRYLWLDRVSRTRMNIAFYRNYGGLPATKVRSSAADCFDNVLKPNLFPQAARCVHDHLSSGRVVVLVTGSIDFLIEPLARHLAESNGRAQRVDLVARTLVERNGVLTGALDGPPIGEAEKAEAVKRYAVAHNVDLSASYGYGDSIADLPMLELVGFPNVVNPDKTLDQLAGARGWTRHQWKNSERAA